MSDKKVWLITGAGRGLGVDIAKAALAAGHAVVATGRDATKVAAAVGVHDNLLVIKLDVTRPQEAEAAVRVPVAKFGRIDILVNNAGNFFAGFFEELSPEQVRNQIETLLFGPMNVTRAALPVMRKQRSGLVVAISSTAGIAGQMFCTAYAAAKFGIEGWMESLTPEIAAFGIRTMLVEPGSSVPSYSATTRPPTPSPLLTAMPNGPRRSSPPERYGWETEWRPRKARQGPRNARRAQGAAGPFCCRHRCDANVRGQGQHAARTGPGPPQICRLTRTRQPLMPRRAAVSAATLPTASTPALRRNGGARTDSRCRRRTRPCSRAGCAGS